MGLSISLFSGGYCLGMGVIVSFLYILGQWPTLRPVLIISATGTHKNRAYSLIILAGMSPGAVDLLVFIFFRYLLTSCGLICGMEVELNGGILMSSFLISLYSLLIADRLSAIASAWSLSDSSFIKSTMIGSDFCWSYEQSLFNVEYH